MLKILDISDYEDYITNTLPEMKEFSLLPGKRIGWNYPLDYSFTGTWLEEINKITPITSKTSILDIGCGPGAIHGYTEHKYGVDVVGLDNRKWGGGDYVDITGNLLNSDIQEKLRKKSKSFDIIMTTSAIEHQPKSSYMKFLEVCKELLSPGGYLIITSTVASRTKYEDKVLSFSISDLEDIYEEKSVGLTYEKVMANWQKFPMISEAFKARYRKSNINFDFLSYGYCNEGK